MLNANKDAERLDLSHVPDGHVKWHGHSGTHPGRLLNNRQFPFGPAIALLGNEDLCSHKNLYASSKSSFIGDRPKGNDPKVPQRTVWLVHTIEYHTQPPGNSE